MRNLIIGLCILLVGIAVILAFAGLLSSQLTAQAPLGGEAWEPIEPPEPGWACWAYYVNRTPVGVWCREAGE